MILITGATGNIDRQRHIPTAAYGRTVRALTHNPEFTDLPDVDLRGDLSVLETPYLWLDRENTRRIVFLSSEDTDDLEQQTDTTNAWIVAKLAA